MKLVGKLVREDFGPGVWTLVTSDGKRVALYGEIPDMYANKTIAVEGEEGMGFGMTGSTAIQVRSIKKA